ncbi:MAG TPA: fructosamine kinase family protein [Kofleriaceae bacterium]|jgi:fructosamine-3-kinase
MTRPGGWRAALTRALGAIAHAESIAGGDINEAWRVELASGERVFVKTHASPPPGMYAAEAEGLAWLAEGPLRVPRVVGAGDAFLALEWLDLGVRGHDGFDDQLGRGLAQLHALGGPSLGLPNDNYLATLPQDNTPAPDLPTFWIERRLRPTITRLDDRLLVESLERQLDRLIARPERFGPPERPARLHGDLWWGNVGSVRGITGAGEPVVFDPAVYCGHREIDLAMLALFGGLGDRLVAAYDEVWPLADGWRERLRLWQLYPLAVHAVLFGGGYVQQLARGLEAAAA